MNIKQINEEFAKILNEELLTRKDYIEKECELFKPYIIASFHNNIHRYLAEFAYEFNSDTVINFSIDNKAVIITLNITRSLASIDFELYSGRRKNSPTLHKHYFIQGSKDMDIAIKEIYNQLKV